MAWTIITLHVNGLKDRSCQVGFKFFKKHDQIHAAYEKHTWNITINMLKVNRKSCTIIND